MLQAGCACSGRLGVTSTSPLTSAGPGRGLHHRPGRTSQPRLTSSGADGSGGQRRGRWAGAESVRSSLENGWGSARGLGQLRAGEGGGSRRHFCGRRSGYLRRERRGGQERLPEAAK